MTHFFRDWLDIEQYPDKEETDTDQWAWEFLRRNKQYQDLWFASLKRNGKINEEAIKEFNDRFLIVHPINPFSKNTKPHFEYSNIKVYQHHFPFKKINDLQLPSEIKPHEVLIKVDLSLPLEMQLRLAKERLSTTQSLLEREGHINVLNHRNRFENYRNYLRVLDAREMKVSWGKIAKVLFSKEDPEKAKDKVRKLFAAAETLRDNDYKLIVTRPSEKPPKDSEEETPKNPNRIKKTVKRKS